MVALYVVVVLTGPAAGPPAAPLPQALAFLQREVPAWAREHRCYSCHNNGDAARALYTAVKLVHLHPPTALADTTRWLTNPKGWDKNGGEGPFNDHKLATLHFAAALATGHEAGLVKDRDALRAAGDRLVTFQDKDGSWQPLADDALPSPITLGTTLATHLGRRALRQIDADRYKDAIARADRWLRKTPVVTTYDAAGVLLALGTAKDDESRKQTRQALAILRKGESRAGGWGPLVNAPPEVFDTAVVLLSLADLETTPEITAWRSRGRAFLVSLQEADGGWPETTRPAGGSSYAQRISTTGWATLALLATSRRTAPLPSPP